MKTKIINIDTHENHTFVTLQTPIGIFTGVSTFNKDEDPLEPSAIIGGRIAEDRAYIQFYNELLRDKRNELKGIKRLINSSNRSKPGMNHLIRMWSTMYYEYMELLSKRREYKQDIDAAIESRKIYVRSRIENKEEKQKKLEELGNAIKTLGQNISKE